MMGTGQCGKGPKETYTGGPGPGEWEMSGVYAAVSEALHKYIPPIVITQRLTVSL